MMLSPRKAGVIPAVGDGAMTGTPNQWVADGFHAGLGLAEPEKEETR